MGIGFSGFVSESSTVGAPTPSKPGLEDIPENCVALVLTHLDPPEICKLARLNRFFREASSADYVWESKLPENYTNLVKKLLDQSPHSLTKKDIYARLCRPTRFDGLSKEVWMEKSGGGICISISWKGMKITGIDDRRYWNHLSTDESRFHNIAYLKQIWWLEVEGNLEFELPRGTYSLYFRLHLGRATTTTTTIKRRGRQVCNHDQVHGWDLKPVSFQFSTSNGQSAMSQYYLKEPGKWVNYQVGDFVVEKPNSTTKIKFSMTQIDCTHPKGGLCLDSVMILPKRVLMEEEVKAVF